VPTRTLVRRAGGRVCDILVQTRREQRAGVEFLRTPRNGRHAVPRVLSTDTPAGTVRETPGVSIGDTVSTNEQAIADKYKRYFCFPPELIAYSVCLSCRCARS